MVPLSFVGFIFLYKSLLFNQYSLQSTCNNQINSQTYYLFFLYMVSKYNIRQRIINWSSRLCILPIFFKNCSQFPVSLAPSLSISYLYPTKLTKELKFICSIFPPLNRNSFPNITRQFKRVSWSPPQILSLHLKGLYPSQLYLYKIK